MATLAAIRALREAIAEYVRLARGAGALTEQVIVTSGSQQGWIWLRGCCSIRAMRSGWRIRATSGARTALQAAGARLVPVPVDAEGLVVERGRAAGAAGARLAYVSPSHQFPLGVTMSAARRLALLRWARAPAPGSSRTTTTASFATMRRPLAALQGIDDDGRVIYVGTFSKTLFPALSRSGT